jgi:hypothetical protein
LKRSPLVATFLSSLLVLLLLVAAVPAPAIATNTTLAASPVAFEEAEEDEDIFFFVPSPWSSCKPYRLLSLLPSRLMLFSKERKKQPSRTGFAFLSDLATGPQARRDRCACIGFAFLSDLATGPQAREQDVADAPESDLLFFQTSHWSRREQGAPESDLLLLLVAGSAAGLFSSTSTMFRRMPTMDSLVRDDVPVEAPLQLVMQPSTIETGRGATTPCSLPSCSEVAPNAYVTRRGPRRSAQLAANPRVSYKS